MAEPVEVRTIAAVLGLDQAGARHHIAIVGGGGKTTLLHALGQQLTGRRIVTCTTKMGHDQHRGLPVLLSPSDDEVVAASKAGLVMAWKRTEGQKAVGVDAQDCDRWFDLIDHVVIEADGSRRRPFKAPADYEPVVPSTATLMLSVIGADALGQVITDQCHRPLRVAALAACSPDDRLTPRAAASVLLHERGARKENPKAAHFAIAITKVAPGNRELVDELIAELRASAPHIPAISIAHHD